MTAVLEELRRLEEAEARGTLRRDEARFRRSRLMDTVEEAQVISENVADPDPPSKTNPSQQLWLLFALIITAFLGVTAVAAWIFRDLTLALTISVTLLAAVIVRAFKVLKW